MNRKVSVAPMMDCTDRHERYFLRLISKNTLLYTEMVVDEAINRGDKKKLLEFNINEKPVALQLGGSSPKLLAEATSASWFSDSETSSSETSPCSFIVS